MVVVAILCLLAAILFPAFNHVRSLGRRTTCASNLKQIGLALNQYAQDNRFYPIIDFQAHSNTNACSPWADKIFPYVKSERIFECPSSQYGAYRSDCPATDPSDEQPITFDGSYNLNIRDASRLRDPVTGVFTNSYKSNQVTGPNLYTRPSSTILVLDGDGDYVSPGYQKPSATDTATLQNFGVPDRHEGGVNVCFADGHVKWMRLDALLKVSLWRINGPE